MLFVPQSAYADVGRLREQYWAAHAASSKAADDELVAADTSSEAVLANATPASAHDHLLVRVCSFVRDNVCMIGLSS